MPPSDAQSQGDAFMVTTDRIVTVPNMLSILRLVLIGLFVWLVLGPRLDMLAVGILAASGITDFLDGYIARRYAQVSPLGQILDPLVDRITIAAVVASLALRDIIPWWLVAVLIGRELTLAILLVPLRRRGLSALPVHYLGKVATFLLFFGLPFLLAGSGDAWWQSGLDVTGWAMVIWGVGLYWYGAVLYVDQTLRILRSDSLPPRASHG